MGYRVDKNNFTQLRNLAFSIGTTPQELENAIQDTGLVDSDELRSHFGSTRISLINRYESRTGVTRKYRSPGVKNWDKPISMISVTYEIVAA